MADAPALTASAASPAVTGRSKRLSRDEQAKLLVQLLEDLQVDTGDVVVFDRACTSMNLYGGAICVCAKFFGQTQWDHNGVVIRDRSQSETSAEALYLLEATLTGVKMRPLVERLLRSKSNEVAVRQLQVARSSDFHDRAFAFANEVLDSPYEDRPRRMLNAGMMAPRRLERERLFDTLIASKKELARLEIDLEHRRNMPDFERKALMKERDRVHEQYHTLVQQLSQTERSMFENELVPDAAAEREAEAKKTHKMFCSQLAANLYQHLGLLLPYPSANSYLPKHFSGNDGGDYLKLQQDATFLPEVSLRAKLEQNHAWHRQLAQEQDARAPQNTEERMTIVRCLRRHQLFHMLSEAELMEISSKFRRTVLRDGEVVFHQGDEGEFFYIIQKGECDVFVDYDFLTKHPPSGDVAQAVTGGNTPAPVPLARRKTLALPDFQNSSSLVGNNERVLVATNGHGTAFGESALIYDTPRRATLRASSGSSSSGEAVDGKRGRSKSEANQVVLWRLDKASFREIVENHPSSQHSMEEQRFLKQAISEHPLFSDLDDHAKFVAVKKCFPLRVPKGTSILTQGDSGDYFYLIESGKCEISRKKPRREQALVDRVIGRGASFGEAALLYNSRRGASVRALEDTKIWCMDRASFLTITRSGSAALFKLFKNVSSHDSSTKTNSIRRDTKVETFVTDASLRRMLQVPRQRSNESEAKLPSEQAYDRAVQLAIALLLHDASGLVNFSQFAHFHIALGASNIEHLLPEAAFRIFKSLVPSDDLSNSAGNPDQSASIKLHNLPRAVRAWVNPGNTDFPDDTALKTQEALYAKLLNLPVYNLGDYFVTQDDLARVFVSLLSYDAEDDPHDDQELAQAKRELLAFIAVLKDDIGALRTIWRAAEFHADYVEDGLIGKQDLTFDANLKSGWISAIRHNPTGGDWEYLQPALESDRNTETNGLRHPEALVKKMIAHAPSFVAAITAGALARTACAPLERLKILMQVTPASTPLEVATKAPYKSLGRGFINMAKISGARSMFSGNLAHCLWVIPSLPTKFLLCDVYRNQLNSFLPVVETSSRKQLKSSTDLRNLVAGGLAGLTANSLLYPLDVVRGRLSAQQYYQAKQQYSGIRDCFRTMYQQEGLRAFYRGFGPSSIGVFSYIGCNYAIYESLRPIFILYDTESTRNQLGHPSVPGQILTATTASLTSQVLSYPFDVVRRRMQLQGAWHPQMTFPSYSSSWNCVTEAMRDGSDGAFRWSNIRVLYRGLFVNSVKALPSAVISFLSYEKIRSMNVDADD